MTQSRTFFAKKKIYVETMTKIIKKSQFFVKEHFLPKNKIYFPLKPIYFSIKRLKLYKSLRYDPAPKRLSTKNDKY